MATTIDDLKRWFESGVDLKAAYMLVVCDTYDWEDYPVYANNKEELEKKADEHNGKNMQKIMECYNLQMSMDEQMKSGNRVWNGWRP